MEYLPNGTPDWLIAVVTIILLFAAYFAGCRLRRRRPITEDQLASDGYIISAVLGLLALLLGFTFALAVERFETRRLLVLEEANAIRTTILRAQTFGEPDRGRLRGLLALYVDNRLALGRSQDRGEAARLLAASDALQRALWAATVAAVGPQRDDVSASFMESMSQTIELGAARRTARDAHVPRRVFTVLLLYMIASTALLGYAIGPQRWRTVTVMLVLLAMSYLLIFDIDEATRGGVRESQQPMEALRALIG